MLLNRILLGATGILLASGAYTTATAASHPAEARGDSTATAQEVTVSNQWDKPLTDIRVEIGGNNARDFRQRNDCGERLGVGKTCSVKVTFEPSGPGPRTATMTVFTSGGSATVELSGTGAGTNVAEAGTKAKLRED